MSPYQNCIRDTNEFVMKKWGDREGYENWVEEKKRVERVKCIQLTSW